MSKCGTRQGYRGHKGRGETPCEPCMEGNRAYSRDRARAKRPGPAFLTRDELVAEAEWLVDLRQGEYRIVAALGYAGKEQNLAVRLRDAGRDDLVQGIFGLTA